MWPTDRQMMIITLIRRSLAAPVSCLSLCHRELPFSPNDHNWNDKPRIFDRGGQVSAHWNKRNHFGGNANGPRKRAVWCVSNWGCLIMLLIYHRRHNVRIIYSNENFICFNYRYESGRPCLASRVNLPSQFGWGCYIIRFTRECLRWEQRKHSEVVPCLFALLWRHAAGERTDWLTRRA